MHEAHILLHLHHLLKREQKEESTNEIKIQLKHITYLSQLLQASVSEPNNMKENNVLYLRRLAQREHIMRLKNQQDYAIEYLNQLEFLYPNAKSTRSFYFTQVKIPDP